MKINFFIPFLMQKIIINKHKKSHKTSILAAKSTKNFTFMRFKGIILKKVYLGDELDIIINLI
jgi:hypothetical protein